MQQLHSLLGPIFPLLIGGLFAAIFGLLVFLVLRPIFLLLVGGLLAAIFGLLVLFHGLIFLAFSSLGLVTFGLLLGFIFGRFFVGILSLNLVVLRAFILGGFGFLLFLSTLFPGICGLLFFLQILEILFKSFSDVVGHLILLLVGQLGRILKLRSVALGFFFGNPVQGITQDPRLHPGEIQQGLSIVEIDLGTLLGGLPELLRQKLASLSETGDSLGNVVEEKVPLSGGNQGCGFFLNLLGCLGFHRRRFFAG